ncbi:SAP domain-containing protein [Niabella insulamsoli]|uniref:SAP domain-containing protein n=1 Tax=Niabella insulamsoli TaxID=3144874 RepID=UPI0031FDF72B
MKKYKDHKIAELRDFCRERGLDTSGKKNDLVSRLLRSDDLKRDMFSQNVMEDGVSIKRARSTAKFSMNDNFYLQLKSSNLSNYFTFGYFYPIALEESEIYKNENRAKDILSIFEEYIIVGRAPIAKLENSDILVELVLKGIKTTEFDNSGLYYVSEPIPVSRVKSIYFKTATARATFLSSTKTFPDSFIPSSICEIIPEENEKFEEIELDKIKLPKNETLSAWKYKLDLFDKVLGLFAFIKNANIIYAERESKFENYSPGFFSTLNLINPIKQFSIYKENTYLKPLLHYHNIEINSAQRVIFKSVIEKVYSNKTFDINNAIEVLQNSIANDFSKNGELADIKELIHLFNQLDRLLISYKEILQKEVIRKNQNLPALALLFLAKFPNKSRQHTDKQAVRNTFIQNEFVAPLNIAEYILGFLGLYYGYKNMVKADTNLRFSDITFEQLASNTQSIKFKLESYFERFIVESAFQFAAHQKILSDSFDFLNWDDDVNNTKSIMLTSNYQYDYSDKSTVVMGQMVLNIFRKDKTEKVFERIANQYSDKVENTTYLASFFAKYFNLDKWHVLDLLKKNKGRYPVSELEDVIDLDSKSKKK